VQQGQHDQGWRIWLSHGDTATFGTSSKEGIELGQKRSTKPAASSAKQIEVIVEDDRGKQEEAKTVVQKLVDTIRWSPCSVK